MSLYTTAILAVVAITLTLLAFRTRLQIWLLDRVAKKIVHDLRAADPQAYEAMLKNGRGPWDTAALWKTPGRSSASRAMAE
jgi:hypothetical protein